MSKPDFDLDDAVRGAAVEGLAVDQALREEDALTLDDARTRATLYRTRWQAAHDRAERYAASARGAQAVLEAVLRRVGPQARAGLDYFDVARREMQVQTCFTCAHGVEEKDGAGRPMSRCTLEKAGRFGLLRLMSMARPPGRCDAFAWWDGRQEERDGSGGADRAGGAEADGAEDAEMAHRRLVEQLFP